MRPIVVCLFDDRAKVEIGHILCEMAGELRPGLVFRFIERPENFGSAITERPCYARAPRVGFPDGSNQVEPPAA
jgi:hypothetical protein